MTAVSEAPAPEAVRPPARGSAELAAVPVEPGFARLLAYW